MSGGRCLMLAVAITALATAAGCGRTALDWVPEPPDDGLAPQVALARFAVIGDYGNDSADEARVARMVSGWDPDFIITTGDNNYPSWLRRHHRREHRQALRTLHRQLPRRVRPGQRHQSLLAIARQPRLGRGNAGGVHRLLHAARQRALLRRHHRPRPPVRAGQRPPGAGWKHGRLVQARWLEATLSTSSACLDVVYFHHTAYSSSVHGPRSRCAGRSRAGALTSSSPATTTRTSA